MLYTEFHVHRVQQVTLDKHRVHLTPDLRSTRRLWRKVIRVHLQWLNMCGCRGTRWISRIPQSLPRKQITISDVIWNLGLFSATTQLTVSWDRYPQYISASFQNKFLFFLIIFFYIDSLVYFYILNSLVYIFVLLLRFTQLPLD